MPEWFLQLDVAPSVGKRYSKEFPLDNCADEESAKKMADYLLTIKKIHAQKTLATIEAVWLVKKEKIR